MSGKQLDALIRNGIASKNIQCCVTQVYHNGETVYEYAGGYGDRNGNPVGKCTLFQVASLTKPIISALVLALFDDDKLQIEKPLSFYIDTDRHDITVRQLLTHTSGLQDVYPDEYMLHHISRYYHIRTPTEILNIQNESEMQFFSEMAGLLGQPDLVRNTTYPRKCFSQLCKAIRHTVPPFYTPGTRYEYCNYGYELLSELITAVAGRPFDQFAVERLFVPLGMHDTLFAVPADRYGDVIKRYKPALAANWFNTDAFMKRATGYDSLKTTAPDMMAFIEMIRTRGKHRDRQIISETCSVALLQNYNRHLPAGFGRSLGFRVHDTVQDFSGSKRSAEAVDHGGMGGAKVMMDPRHGVTVIYFTVENKGCDRTLYDQFINAVYDSFI